MLCHVTLAVWMFVPVLQTADDAPTLETRDAWANVFADKEVQIRFTIKSAKALRGQLIWSLAAENDRTLNAGEAEVNADKDKPGEATVKFRAPEVKPGVTLKTRLRVRLEVAGNSRPAATHERAVWVFPEDPFAIRREWLKGLKISLFDPEKTTAEHLKKLEVPFEEINTVPALGEVKEGLVVVGAGVSFKEFSDLPETLTKAAASGLPVLCLAPAGGFFPVPGSVAKGPQPRMVNWRRADHISILDKRLDATGWPPEGKAIASTLAIKVEDATVVAEASSRTDDWAWLEAEYPTKHGRLIVCGFGLTGKAWDASPTPRYLFARLLEVLTDKNENTPDKETDR